MILLKDTHELIVTGVCVRAMTYVSITGPIRVAPRGNFSFSSFIFYLISSFFSVLFFFLFVLVPSCWFRVIKHKHTQCEMTRCIGRISSHDSDQTRVIEIYTHTRTQRDDTPQWLTASVITSFNFHTFSFLSQCTCPHDSGHLHKRSRYNNIIYPISVKSRTNVVSIDYMRF